MNYHYLVAVSGTPLPALTYTSDIHIVAGTRVLIPLAQRQLVGVVLRATEAPTDNQYAVKDILAVLDEQPLWQEAELKLLAWCARYYHADWGRLLETALPPQLRLSKQPTRPAKMLNPPTLGQAALVSLNEEQQHASDQITDSFGQFKAWLLMGVTGSGKTEVYAQLIDAVLQQAQQVLMLVPEIGPHRPYGQPIGTKTEYPTRGIAFRTYQQPTRPSMATNATRASVVTDWHALRYFCATTQARASHCR